MIRVTIELVPHGTGTPEQIGSMIIANDGTGRDEGNGKLGNYTYQMWSKRRGKPWHSGRVTGFPRQRKNVWHLLKLVLGDALK